MIPRPIATTILLLSAVIVLTTACRRDPAAGSVAAAVESEAIADDLPSVLLVPAFPRLTFFRPVFVTHAGDRSGRLFVVEQSGRIRSFADRPDVEQDVVFLDIRKRVRMRHNEEGLLALAFHPRFSENRHFFVYYTASSPRRGVLSRFTAEGSAVGHEGGRADPASEHVILEVPQPFGNHNGATVLFGPDDLLYLSLGDGGDANDPFGHGQNLGTLLGSIVRIDIDREEDGRRYGIPADNPFVDRPGARGEIWAYGLRNVWRMSFDRETGDLWAGDVGQNRWEEIDLIIRGGNYGWNLREGKHPFRSGRPLTPMSDPVLEYNRAEGESVTGGYVYRGSAIPELEGAYVYADYANGRIRALRYENGSVTAHRQIVTDRRPRFVSSFGEDANAEILVCVFDGLDGRRRGRGHVFRLMKR